MITFHLPASAVDRLAFAYSPALEAVLSLHVLIEPKHHPLQHEWVRRMRGLSPTLKREIAAFGFVYRSHFPAFFYPTPTGPFPGFADELTRLRAFTPEVLAFEFTETFAATRDPARLNDPAARDRLLTRAAELAPKSLDLVRLVLDEPHTVLDRFLDLLTGYWDEAFGEEWARLEKLLAASVAEAGTTLAAHGLYPFLRGLRPEIRADEAAGRFWLDRRHEHDVTIGPDERFTLVPSFHAWPHVRVNCDRPWPPTLVFPMARRPRPPVPPEDLLRVLRALADETRLRALRLIAERPRSTQELAPLVGLSEAALSRHLRLMAEAGVLTTERSGYYVLYRLAPEPIDVVVDGLRGYLEG
ncbi:hypothetical protein Afil01_17730 [Actinorhabdospora filicis]|uniref:HTH arsR-type domain-containing protein n=1 Tax=Actinorhabdospora filicis TaxID=1785913 RepID=A0A9W6SJT8_9ACTN|nr:DUF5937 family protein [Actinorhabdospora filicis]GLZ76966.1 hypothetical protein Afil01_17730 [Actinorhabdospora filicis]